METRGRGLYVHEGVELGAKPGQVFIMATEGREGGRGGCVRSL